MIDESDQDYLSDRLERQGETLTEIKDSLSTLANVLTTAFAPQIEASARDFNQKPLRQTHSTRVTQKPKSDPALLARAQRLLSGEPEETSDVPEPPSMAMGRLATVSPVGEVTNPRAREEAINSRFAQIEAQIDVLMNAVRLHAESLQNMYAELVRKNDSNIIQGVGF